jgi:hypothetical protein
MATALLKITQGATTDNAGRAVKGALGTNVVFSNGDDTGVVSWKYELLDVPPASAIVPFTQGPGAVATFGMGVPDAVGSYRVRLTVLDAAGNADVDIRNFTVPTASRGWLIPPYQGFPAQLPLSGIGSKPDELNFGGQAKGWHGDNNAARKLLYQILVQIDSLL